MTEPGQAREPMLASEFRESPLMQPSYREQRKLFLCCGYEFPGMRQQDVDASYSAIQRVLTTEELSRFHYVPRAAGIKIKLAQPAWGVELERVGEPVLLLNDQNKDTSFHDLRLALNQHGWRFGKVVGTRCIFLPASVPFEPEAISEQQTWRPFSRLSRQQIIDPQLPRRQALIATQQLELAMPRTRGLGIVVDKSQTYMDADHADVPGIVTPRGQPSYELQDTLVFILGFGNPGHEDIMAWMTAAQILVNYRFFKDQGYVIRSNARTIDDRWGKIVIAWREHRPQQIPNEAEKDTNFRFLQVKTFELSGWFLVGRWKYGLLFMSAFPGRAPKVPEEKK